MSYDFDLITIGAGSGGSAASRRVASYGVRVAICEASRVGGTCVIRGCVPKKLFMYAGQFRDAFEDSVAFGWDAHVPSFDWLTLKNNKDREIERLSQKMVQNLETSGCTILTGHARLIDDHTVLIDDQTYRAETILIATGAWPSKLSIPGIESAITSNDIFDLPSLPESLTIIGGGYIAIEFACILAALGVTITVVIRGQHILKRFDDDLRIMLESEMKKRGITILNGFEPVRIDESTITATDGRVVTSTMVMVATGRHPHISNLGLEESKVKLTKNKAIAVDEWSRTSVESIYAIGDVTDRVALTPVAIAEGRAFAETCFNNNPIRVHYRNIPTAVFSIPAISTVGLTQAQAQEQFGKIDIYQTRFRAMKHSLSGRDEETLIKMIVDPATDHVLGCHMLGSDAPEIIQSLAIAFNCQATKKQFDRTIALHPSVAEEFVLLNQPISVNG